MSLLHAQTDLGCTAYTVSTSQHSLHFKREMWVRLREGARVCDRRLGGCNSSCYNTLPSWDCQRNVRLRLWHREGRLSEPLTGRKGDVDCDSLMTSPFVAKSRREPFNFLNGALFSSLPLYAHSHTYNQRGERDESRCTPVRLTDWLPWVRRTEVGVCALSCICCCLGWVWQSSVCVCVCMREPRHPPTHTQPPRRRPASLTHL